MTVEQENKNTRTIQKLRAYLKLANKKVKELERRVYNMANGHTYP